MKSVDNFHSKLQTTVTAACIKLLQQPVETCLFFVQYCLPIKGKKNENERKKESVCIREQAVVNPSPPLPPVNEQCLGREQKVQKQKRRKSAGKREHARTHARTQACARAHTHTHTHTHTYARTHAQTCERAYKDPKRHRLQAYV